jgi:hypothetical protein
MWTVYIDGQEEHKLYTDILRYAVCKNKYYIHVIEVMHKIKAQFTIYNTEL